MAQIELKSEDIETGYAATVAMLTKALAKANIERAALARHIEESEPKTLEIPLETVEEEPDA
jgi:hypothetical protein